MTQRNDILQEYFSLVKDLNQTNKFKNEHTQLSLKIEYQNNGRGVLYAMISEKQKVRLCEQSTLNAWTISSSIKYEKFSLFALSLIKEFSKKPHEKEFNEYFFVEFNLLLSFKD